MSRIRRPAGGGSVEGREEGRAARGAVALGRVPDAPGRLRRLVDRWRGRRVVYDLRPYLPDLQRIGALEEGLRGLADAALRERAERVRRALAAGADEDAHVVETYALVREAARRTVGLRPFDVQLVGGLVLREGAVLEMATGEGKTLVAVLPAVLAALRGEGVHVLTFNDYLARRDAAWMGPVYAALGVTVAHVQAGLPPDERRAAYRADVTYLTAKEAGFDYLRDGLCLRAGDRVHRGFPFALVDEADSILVDEARIPLVIAGRRGAETYGASRMAALAESLRFDEDYETDADRRNVSLTEAGQRRVEEALGCGSLYEVANAPLLAQVNVALHARELLVRDVDYIVRSGAIELVDELTGRVVPDRHWPDGLQTALEAKEGLRLRDEGVVLGSITLQHFFALYDRLSGMTATARPEEDELLESYGLPTVVLPPHRPCIRDDRPERLFTHREAKEAALVATIEEAHRVGRPVLVGTASVRESERLAERIRARGLACEVLNAKTDEREARIVAEAGAPGAITISTNMAGRGTDIRLGGSDERGRDAVVEVGGLYVIGTNLHESRRIDRQLRGRAGRQGDPGTSEFFVSLEDDLVVRHGLDAILPRHAARQEAPVDHPQVRRRLAWAQRVIEGQSFDIRLTLNKYARFIESHRRWVRDLRDALLEDRGPPSRWAAARPERHADLVALLGEAEARELERQATLRVVDDRWAEHLGLVTDLRETIHVVRLGNKDPLQEFLRAADTAFEDTRRRIDEDTVAVLDALELTEAGLAAGRRELEGPSSTWTYLVDDNPWRDALGLHLSPSLALSIGAAIYYPLYLAVSVYRRYFRRRGRRGGTG